MNSKQLEFLRLHACDYTIDIGLKHMCIGVNINGTYTTILFKSTGYISDICRSLDKYIVNPKRITIEQQIPGTLNKDVQIVIETYCFFKNYEHAIQHAGQKYKKL